MMAWHRRIVAALLPLALLAGCHGGSHIPRQKQASKLALPSTFTGVLP